MKYKPNKLLLKHFVKALPYFYTTLPNFPESPDNCFYYNWYPKDYIVTVGGTYATEDGPALKIRRLKVPPEILAYLKLRYP